MFTFYLENNKYVRVLLEKQQTCFLIQKHVHVLLEKQRRISAGMFLNQETWKKHPKRVA